jgi:hypothetical protein
MNVRLGSATTIPLADCGEILAVADVAAADSRSGSALASEVTDQERRLPLGGQCMVGLAASCLLSEMPTLLSSYSKEIQLLAHC